MSQARLEPLCASAASLPGLISLHALDGMLPASREGEAEERAETPALLPCLLRRGPINRLLPGKGGGDRKG